MTMKKIQEKLLSLPVLCLLLLAMSLTVTWFAPKDDNSDAWSYHYYSGNMLFDNRLDTDYFGASIQGYFNPLVHAPFAAMINARWPDRWVAMAMAGYCSLALMLMAVFYRVSLNLTGWTLFSATLLSISMYVVWTCMGSSVPDLFIQIPFLISLLCLFNFRKTKSATMVFWAGAFFGVFLGLKLSAIIYIPGYAVLLCYWLWLREIRWTVFVVVALGCILGFLLCYGWWGLELYKHLGNPFFPFFNDWFKSPHFSAEAVYNKRFISWNLAEQLLLPFKAAGSEVLTYIEMREPDIRLAVFVVAVLALAVFSAFQGRKDRLEYFEKDFLIFLFISLYTWVLISGNGRYGITIFLMVGAGIFIACRAILPLKIYRSLMLLVIIFQIFVMYSVRLGDKSVVFRFNRSPWNPGAEWFDIDFKKTLGSGGQLVMTGMRNSISVLVKDIGPDSSVINVYGGYALENSEYIQSKITQYDGRIVSVIKARKDLLDNREWIEKTHFEQFGRFGLKVADTSRCVFEAPRGKQEATTSGFFVCPMEKDVSAIGRYEEITRDARKYYEKIEKICPELFSPKKYAITVLESSKEKYYSNSEIDTYMKNTEEVFAKKIWSMMIYRLGPMSEMDAISPKDWSEKYCDPLLKSRAVSRE